MTFNNIKSHKKPGLLNPSLDNTVLEKPQGVQNDNLPAIKGLIPFISRNSSVCGVWLKILADISFFISQNLNNSNF